MDQNLARLPRVVHGPARSPRDKVRTVDELARVLELARNMGQVVVQAHGTFDLLHIGHVRHLQAARELGDVLVVTVTADRYVNKGPGRPVFGEALRAEMLATLAYVDWVAINDSADSVSAIETLRPDIYVKGQDYVNPEGDVTGKIIYERAAVEAHGGCIHFTNEETFSSTELINRHFNVYEPHVRDHLTDLRNDSGLLHLLNLIEKIKDYRVLVVGDAIIDEYQYVLPMAKPPKENIIATRYQDTELFAGGVFAAANHVASFCKQVDVVTCLGGAADNYEPLIRRSLLPNVHLHAFKRDSGPTTVKRRFVDSSYMRKLFEVCVLDDEPLTGGLQQDFDERVSQLAPKADVVITADFGHGLIGASTVSALVSCAPFLAVNTQTNSANTGFNLITKYPKADYICIDASEARLAVSDRVSRIDDVARKILHGRVECSRLIVTNGKHGCITYEAGQPVHTIPAVARKVVDTVGAGDAFLAVTAPLVAAGGSIDRVGFIGNVVGALKVEIVGHRTTIEKSAVIKAITALLK